jgi:hypothetical protein
MRVNPSTVQRHLQKGFSLPVLRSKRLAGPFVAHLCRLVEKRNGRAA